MSKVEIGELKELITNQPDIAPTLALATKIIWTGNKQLGDYTSIMIAGTDEFTPEIIISKKELRAFAQKVLEEVK